MNLPVSRLGTSPEEGVKAPVVVATPSNITLSGEQTISSVSVVAGDRVLVMNQNDATENGIYVASTTAWTRATDFNEADDVVNGVMVLAANSGYIYQAFFTGDYDPDTTEVQFTRNVFSDLQSEQFFYDNHASSAANAYAIKVPAAKTTPTEYLANIMVTFRPSHANTSTTVTLRVLGASGLLSALPYVMEDGSTLPTVGFLTTDRDVTARLSSDGTKWIHVYKKIDQTATTFSNIGGSATDNSGILTIRNDLRWQTHRFFTNHASSAADAYVLVHTTLQAPEAWITGGIYEFRPSHANTGACTVDIIGVTGSKAYKMEDGTNPVAGFMNPNVYFRAYYNGTNLVHMQRGYVAQTWGTTDIDNDAITLAKLAHGTAYKVIGFNASGVPSEMDNLPRLLTSGSIGATDSAITCILSSLDTTQAVGNAYQLRLFGIQPATDNKDLYMTLSTDSGSSYLAGTTCWWMYTSRIVGGSDNKGSAGDAQLIISLGHDTNSLSNVASEVLSATIDFLNVNTGTSVMPNITWRGTCWDANATARPVQFHGGGGVVPASVGDIDAFKLTLESGGNFAASVGRWELWKMG